MAGDISTVEGTVKEAKSQLNLDRLAKSVGKVRAREAANRMKPEGLITPKSEKETRRMAVEALAAGILGTSEGYHKVPYHVGMELSRRARHPLSPNEAENYVDNFAVAVSPDPVRTEERIEARKEEGKKIAADPSLVKVVTKAVNNPGLVEAVRQASAAGESKHPGELSREDRLRIALEKFAPDVYRMINKIH